LLCVPYFLSLSHLLSTSHQGTSALSTISHCTMLHCPNPFCARNRRKTKKPFPTSKSFSNHIEQSPECKAFVFKETASVNAPPMPAPSKQATKNTTTLLFKKQRL
jgi:hypothetical protein